MSTTTLPNKPSEMPRRFACDSNQVRNWLMEFDSFAFASVTWVMDVAASNAADEPVGKWEVKIHAAKQRISGESEELEEALWYAITLANAAQDERFAQREAVKDAALAKLTDEEKKLLGLRA